MMLKWSEKNIFFPNMINLRKYLRYLENWMWNFLENFKFCPIFESIEWNSTKNGNQDKYFHRNFAKTVADSSCKISANICFWKKTKKTDANASSSPNLDKKCVWLLAPAAAHKMLAKFYFLVTPLKKSLNRKGRGETLRTIFWKKYNFCNILA